MHICMHDDQVVALHRIKSERKGVLLWDVSWVTVTESLCHLLPRRERGRRRSLRVLVYDHAMGRLCWSFTNIGTWMCGYFSWLTGLPSTVKLHSQGEPIFRQGPCLGRSCQESESNRLMRTIRLRSSNRRTGKNLIDWITYIANVFVIKNTLFVF